MIKIFPEKLKVFACQKSISRMYFLIGEDPFLLIVSQRIVKKIISKEGFSQLYHFYIDKNFCWSTVLQQAQTPDLFTRKRIFCITLLEEQSMQFNTKLSQLLEIHNKNIFFIFKNIKHFIYQKYLVLFKKINKFPIIVDCNTPRGSRFLLWYQMYLKSLNLYLSTSTRKLLLTFYEGNLLALSQTLDKISLLFPYGNKIEEHFIEKIIKIEAHFAPFHWINAILSGNTKQAIFIIKQLKKKQFEAVILLRTLQKAVFLLLELERKYSSKRNLKTVSISSVQESLIHKASRRLLRTGHVYKAINMIYRMELQLKKYNQSIWNDLDQVSILLCS